LGRKVSCGDQSRGKSLVRGKHPETLTLPMRKGLKSPKSIGKRGGGQGQTKMLSCCRAHLGKSEKNPTKDKKEVNRFLQQQIVDKIVGRAGTSAHRGLQSREPGRREATQKKHAQEVRRRLRQKAYNT